MDIHTFADALIRELFWHYDHGGISGRVMKAQLLETIFPRSLALSQRKELPRINVNLGTPEKAKEYADAYPAETQLFLFSEPHLLSDHDHRCVVIATVDALSRDERKPAIKERIVLCSLGTVYRLDEPGAAYREYAVRYEPSELLSASWKRMWSGRGETDILQLRVA